MNKLVLAVATGLGLGYSPKAPGTVGSLLGVLLLLIFPQSGLLALFLILIGILTAQIAEGILGEKDSPKIVIDEVAGMYLSALGLGGYYVIPGFILFRFFDIVKPGPIKKLQELPGGIGVMVDDLAAGLLVNIILLLARQLFNL